MKIVVFSDLWPPVFIGGYEIGASQIVTELKRRGHEILLLSAHEHYLPRDGRYVCCGHAAEDRAGILDTGLCIFGSVRSVASQGRFAFLRKLLATVRARRRYRAAIRAFRPDAFLVFNPLGVVATVIDDFVSYSRRTGVPVTAYVSDHWLAGWPAANPLWTALAHYRQSTRRWVRLANRGLMGILSCFGLIPDPLPLLDRYLYCSKFIRDLSRENSVGVAEHAVVHWGLPGITQVPGVPADHFTREGPLTLVFAGQLLEHKGFATLVRALADCKARHRLVVLGDDQTDYAHTCRTVAGHLGVLDQIEFLGKRSNSEMLQLLRESGQALVVPSAWDEPFSIVVLEGMGVGLPVIASNTGGTGEAIEDGETGFLFPRHDARALARVIDRLDADRALCRRVGARARQCVMQRFTMEGMVDQILAHVAKPAAAPLRIAA